MFEPGTDFVYTGVVYFLLAKVLEVVSGQTYSEFLKFEIFEPLAMHDTGADRPEVLLLQRASGYVRRQDGTVRNARHIFMPILTGGDNLYSTAVDMARSGVMESRRARCRSNARPRTGWPLWPIRARASAPASPPAAGGPPDLWDVRPSS
ncbi:MAG: serine hydrolase [Acidobacteria bacterium]|nr:serine hydrolase [Acidobacteriota bacterium]NIM60716.1 serine hydrolase [Acidobacteriota bacterium]NIO59536.1 serine hydrolase [Acidobacteriota bacterium]NIQ85522.1 serine hydrolase [Acidobacteriota bacterium]NIT11243.1 serine hydrolase [Acidobacteriota bacterium]